MLLHPLESVAKTAPRRSERERAARTDAREPTRVTRRRARVTAVYSNSRVASREPSGGSTTTTWSNSDPWLYESSLRELLRGLTTKLARPAEGLSWEMRPETTFIFYYHPNITIKQSPRRVVRCEMIG